MFAASPCLLSPAGLFSLLTKNQKGFVTKRNFIVKDTTIYFVVLKDLSVQHSTWLFFWLFFKWHQAPLWGEDQWNPPWFSDQIPWAALRPSTQLLCSRHQQHVHLGWSHWWESAADTKHSLSHLITCYGTTVGMLHVQCCECAVSQHFDGELWLCTVSMLRLYESAERNFHTGLFRIPAGPDYPQCVISGSISCS